MSGKDGTPKTTDELAERRADNELLARVREAGTQVTEERVRELVQNVFADMRADGTLPPSLRIVTNTHEGEEDVPTDGPEKRHSTTD